MILVFAQRSRIALSRLYSGEPYQCHEGGHVRKLDNDQAMRFPIAFQHFGGSATSDVPSPIARFGCWYIPAVFLENGGIGYVYISNKIRCHRLAP
jgi:hypothetical protein